MLNSMVRSKFKISLCGRVFGGFQAAGFFILVMGVLCFVAKSGFNIIVPCFAYGFTLLMGARFKAQTTQCRRWSD